MHFVNNYVICEMDLRMSLSGSLVVLAALVPGQQPSTDFEHDFRGGGCFTRR